MFWIAVAAQLSVFYSTDPRSVFSPDDMPAYVQLEGINRFVRTRTTVGADGTARDCAVEGGSGDPKLDALTCAIILRRAKFTPPKWIDGSSAYGVIRAPVTWAIGDSPSDKEKRTAYPPDIELEVDKLPAGADSPSDVRLLIAVDVNGKVLGCNEAPTMRFDKANNPELVPIACDQMKSTFTAIPAKDATGTSVRSIQTALVTFVRRERAAHR
jgi:hypothetical protein